MSGASNRRVKIHSNLLLPGALLKGSHAISTAVTLEIRGIRFTRVGFIH
jgi:hypothetical protein